MTVEVVTVWVPRPQHPKWMDYLPLLRLQKRTAERFGHHHLVVSDRDVALPGFDVLHAPLSYEVMPAMIDGVIARLRGGEGNCSIVFVDCDCLINRDLHDAFKVADFELGLTRRQNDLAPINNGAMYVRLGAHHLAATFFDGARARCGTHWGADQEAISAEAAPVPEESGVVSLRGPLRVGFLSMKTHGAVPKAFGARHHSRPFVVHFKGDKKSWAQIYAERWILPE